MKRNVKLVNMARKATYADGVFIMIMWVIFMRRGFNG